MGFAPEWDFVDIQIIVSTKYPDCVFPYYVFVVIFFFVVCPTRVSFKHPLSVCLWYSVIFVLIALTLILSLFSGLFVPPACARVSLKHPQGRLYGRVQLRTKGVHHLWNKVSGLYCFAFKVAQVGWSLKVLGDWGTDRRGPMPRLVGLCIAHLVDDELGIVNPLIRSPKGQAGPGEHTKKLKQLFTEKIFSKFLGKLIFSSQITILNICAN